MTPNPPPSQPGCRNQFQARPGRHRSIVKGALFGLVLIVMAVALHQYGGALSLQSIASKEEALRTLKQSSPLAVTLTALGIYVAATGLSLPGAAGLSLVYGWFFGFGPGLVIVSIGIGVGPGFGTVVMPLETGFERHPRFQRRVLWRFYCHRR